MNKKYHYIRVLVKDMSMVETSKKERDVETL
jgi:hypothetical protein